MSYAVSIDDEYGGWSDSITDSVEYAIETLTNNLEGDGPYPVRPIELWKCAPLSLQKFRSAKRMTEYVQEHMSEVLWDEMDDTWGELSEGFPADGSKAHTDLVAAIDAWMNAYDPKGWCVPVDRIETLMAVFDPETEQYVLVAASKRALKEITQSS